MTLRPLALMLALALGTSTLVAQSLPDPATATQRADSALEDVQESVNNRVTFEGHAADLERMLSEYQSLLSAEQVSQYRAQLKISQAEYQRFAQTEDLQRLDVNVAALEQQWQEAQVTLGDASPNSREGAIEDLRRGVEDLRKDAAKLPSDSTRALVARIDAVSQAFEAQAGASANAEQLAQLEDYWQRDTADSAGWEQEKAVDLDTYVKTRSQETSAFGLPKTLEIFEQATHKLEQAKEDGGAPAVYIAKLDDVRTRSRANLLGAVSALVTAAAAKDASDERAREAMGLLDESLRVTLNAENDAEFAALSAKSGAWLKAAADADTSSEEGRARYYERMTVSAKAAWPQMESQFDVVRGFDPTNPGALAGQLIRIETDNLMGWRFNTGDFPFATTISGMPVAAIYDPEVEAAIADVEAKLGRQLGDSDDDGRWTIIAEVTDRMGRMSARKQVDGEIRDSSSGEKLGTYSGEHAEAVDAPILKIVAAYVGPLAVARGVGVAAVDGSLTHADAVASNNGPSAGSGAAAGSWLGRTPALLLGLFAALMCWVQARPDAAQALARSQGQAALLDRARPWLPLAGVAIAAFGVFWLLRGLIVADLLPALALIAAGGYSALPLLRQWLPADKVERLAPLGQTVALAAAAIAGAHLWLGGQVLI
jgi:hypothetical protein